MFLRFIKLIKNSFQPIVVIPFLFLVIGVATIPDYNINWDSFIHFSRGQAYLQYFLIGSKGYSKLPQFKISDCNSGNLGLFVMSCERNSSRRSYYQSDYYDFNYFVKNDSGHPPLNDILAASINYIFYQKLGLVNDTFAYHLFIVFSSFLLIFGVAYFVKSELGIFPAVVSSLVLASNPLFFSESHFNIKDPPEAAFFGLALIFFYWGIAKNNWKFILVSSISAGLALGTKFNVVFAGAVAIPWLVFYIVENLFRKLSVEKVSQFLKNRKWLIVSLLMYLPISFGLVYIFWPYLWQDSVRNISSILGYYAQIGVGTPPEMSKYILGGWNFYPFYWIVVTTTLPALFLTIVGILSFNLFKRLNKARFYLFIMLWFLIPIVRVSLPNADIYGGIRQIMEYIPAMAILAGMGAFCLIEFAKKADQNIIRLTYLVISIGLLFSMYEIVRIHPNENIYFNQLVGGLPGAKGKNIPYWGNTYGAVYLQGVRWINANVENEAKVALPIGVMSNIPRTMLRSDIDYAKPNWTGPGQGGEYGIEMYFEWPQKYWYSFQYYDKYLDPVYVYSVDGVPILKVWKNDLVHTRPGFRDEISYSSRSIVIEKNILGTDMKIDMGRDIFLTRLIVRHENFDCQNGLLGYVALSSDGKIWQREPEPITLPQVAPGVDGKLIGWNDTNFVYLFAGKKARFIMFDPQTINSCYLKNFEVQVSGLKVLP